MNKRILIMIMDNNHNPLFDEEISNILRGTFDKKLMNEALKRAKNNKDKAQALYVLRVCNGYWPSLKNRYEQAETK